MPKVQDPQPFAEAAAEGASDIELLHAISVALIGEPDRMELYGKIVDAAIAITRSQFGTMQLLCPEGDPSGHGGELRLLCSRNLPDEAIGFWQWVSPAAHSSCTQALKTEERAIIADYESWDEIQGTPDLEAFRSTGIRAAQTTPLRSRDGTLLGMISTHWSAPHQPSERDLRLLDILARQAADLLERTIADEALRMRERDLEKTCAALRESEELQTILTGELSHRVKNMLAMVQAIAAQTLRHSASPEDFAASFNGRIQSMSRVHAQLSTNDWKSTPLRDVVRDQLRFGPVDEAQIHVSGPDVDLDAAEVPRIAMILHELGTNSLKYGALSRPAGIVALSWSLSGTGLSLHWAEKGGPEVKAPLRRGFGTRLIQASVPGKGGQAVMSIGADGVLWDIRYPLNADVPAQPGALSDPLVELATALRVDAFAEPILPSLEGKRILVVEDEPLLAMDIAGQLQEAGAYVVGPVASVEAALRMIEEYRLDAALLDANLQGYPVDDVAASLSNRNVPFIFVSGYDRDTLPAAFDATELLVKPFESSRLIDMTGRLVA